jgi:hypothetical protein
MTYKVYDNFLDKQDFLNLKNTMLGNNFPWFYHEKTITTYMENSAFYRDDKSFAKSGDYQFTHNFYSNHLANSTFFELVIPLIQKINPKSVVRIKANLTNKTDRSMVYGFHVDQDNAPSNLKTAVYYVNTTNGPTLFEDGTEVESLENRLVIFDTNLVHSAVSQTDERARIVINFNFYENF